MLDYDCFKMRSPSRSRALVFPIVSVILLALTQLFWVDLAKILGFGLPLVLLVLGAVTLSALVGLAVAAARRRSARLALATVVLVGVTIPIWREGRAWGSSLWMRRHRDVYEDVVQQLSLEQPTTEQDREQPIRHRVDPGPPLRVAFPWPGGILDNWCGAVHDPTGTIGDAGKDAGGFVGGQSASCSLHEGSWYVCCFT